MAAVGVLALQGDFAAHLSILRRLGAEGIEVRRTEQLRGLSALVIPGGESTAILKLMAGEPWFEEIRRIHSVGAALLGTCAGAILLARRVEGRDQPCLGLIEAVIRRNAYGRQIDSFETKIDLGGSDLRAVFIRAPRFASLESNVEVLAALHGEPVVVRQGKALAATFHPELAGEERLHRLLLEMAGEIAVPGDRRADLPAQTVRLQ